jgi:CHAT domain-containing protein/Tfp pilus assembly protein PilF
MLLFGGCVKKPEIQTTTPPNVEGDKLTQKADNLAGKTLYSNSNYYLKKAINTFRESGHWEEVIRNHIKIGDNYQKIDRYSIAGKHLDAALDIAKSYASLKQLDIALNYQKIAHSYLTKGDFDGALESYQKALDIRLEIQGSQHPQVAKIYNSMSQVYWNQGDTLTAKEYYNKSLFIKIRFMVDLRFYTMVKNYKIMDAGESGKQSFKKAKDFFTRALALNKDGHHPLVADVYENIGIISTYEGDYERALEFFGKAIRSRLETFGEDSLHLARNYHNIGICLAFKGDIDEAEDYLQRAMNIKQKALSPLHPELADTYYQLGKVKLTKELLDEALKYFQLGIKATVPGVPGDNIYKNPSIEGRFSSETLLKLLTAKAEALSIKFAFHPTENHVLEFSLSTYLLAVQLVEKTRIHYKSEDYKLYFGEKCQTIFDQAIQTAMNLYTITGQPKYKITALEISEKSKAAVLTEALYESRAREFSGIPQDLLNKEQQLKEQLVAYETQLEGEYQSTLKKDSPKYRELEKKYFSVSDEYQRLIEHFEQNYNKYFQLKYRFPAISLQEIQSNIPLDTTIVEYFVGEKNIYIFIIGRKEFEAIDVPKESTFEASVEKFHNSIKKIEEKTFVDLSQQLFQKLMAPVTEFIPRKGKLVVIPHGCLYFIPFETFIASPQKSNGNFSELDYLVKRYDFSYHYSARLWLYSKETPLIDKKQRFIGFAPIFSDQPQEGYIIDTSTRRSASVGDEGARSFIIHKDMFSELPATERELRNIIEMFKGSSGHAMGFFHKQATEDAFKSLNMEQYSYVHIATHSLKNMNNPSMSGLIFARPKEDGLENDGILFSSEAYNLNLNARLIVLSSCESGIGKLINGEGMMAMHRGFFYSGAQNIIFSLWKIEDKATSTLMVEFYKNILKKARFPSALRRAKLRMIQNPYTAFPKYWSGFILLGM